MQLERSLSQPTRPQPEVPIILFVKPTTILSLLLAVLVVACAGEQTVEPAVPQESTATLPSSPTPFPTEATAPTETVAATAVPVTEATQEPLPATATQVPEAVLQATEQPLVAQVVSGQTEEGAYFYGNPDAAVTLIDYSDFL